MIKNALVFRISQWQTPPLEELEARLQASRFVACSPSQTESAGWLEPRGEAHAPLLENVGGQWWLKLCTERKAVPGAVVKEELETLLQRAEAETGRRPKGKLAKEMKEQVVHALLPRAFPKRASTWVWIDPAAGLLFAGTGSTKQADALSTRLVELLGGGIRLTLLQTQTSPAVAMSAWLQEKEAPSGFSLDRECELKQPDSEKSLVRYARHPLEIDEVGEHIRQGKLPTQLAMTWQSRVSFVLTEIGAVKKLKLLDVALEGAGRSGGKDDNGFDADAALTAGEYAPLFAALIEALGGEQVAGGAPGASTATPAAGAVADDRLAA